MTLQSSCRFCLGRLRQGLTTCKDCQLSLWKLERLDQADPVVHSCLTHTLHRSGSPIVQKSFESPAKGKHSSNDLASAMCRQQLIVTMKRSMGLASSDLSSSDSSKDPSPVKSSDGEESVRKCARTNEETGSQVATGVPAKTSSSGVHDKCLESVEDVAEEQKSQSASSSRTTPLTRAKDAVTSQVQQLFKQSARTESNNLHRESPSWAASHYVPYPMPSQSFNSAFHHYPAASGYPLTYPVQQSSPFTFLQGVQPGALGPVMYPLPHIYSMASRYFASAHFHHSTSQSNVTPQMQKASRMYFESEDSKDKKQIVTASPQDGAVAQKEKGVTQKASHKQYEAEVSKDREWSAGSAHQDAAVARREQSRNPARAVRSKAAPDCVQVDANFTHEKAAVCSDADTSQPSDEETDVEVDSLKDYKKEKYHRKLKQLPRKWELTRFGTIQHSHHRASRSRRQQPVEFSLMTYNILAQDALENHPYLYSGSRSRVLEWEHRRRRLIAEIACHDPDILNLQEVQEDHFFDYLKPRLLRLGYTGVYEKRTGDKSDGCASMWKKDKFQLLRSTPVNYCRGGLLDRDNIALIVELQPFRPGYNRENFSSPTEDKLVIANTHLLFNPRRGDIKLAQLMILMAEIDRHAYLGPSHDAHHHLHPYSWDTMRTGRYCPVIVTGDFNMEPQSELYKFMVSGQMDYEGLLVKEMSGQEEGMYGRNTLLDRNFFSPMYGVTDFCQYHTAVMNRFKETYGTEKPDGQLSSTKNESTVEEELPSPESEVSSSTVASSETKDRNSEGSAQMPINTGRLWHHLNFVSAYRHRIERLGEEAEVTTHHNRARCSVDYIFYTVDNKEVHFYQDEVRLSNIRDGQLRLMARYGLMSAKELDKLGGIPSPALPSDHLCLITKFLLK